MNHRLFQGGHLHSLKVDITGEGAVRGSCTLMTLVTRNKLLILSKTYPNFSSLYCVAVYTFAKSLWGESSVRNLNTVRFIEIGGKCAGLYFECETISKVVGTFSPA